MGAPEPELYMRRVLVPTPNGGPVGRGYDVFVGKRKVGRLNTPKTAYYTWRDELRHYARVPAGYGIEKALADKLFDPASSLKAVVLVIRHEDGRTVRYWTPVEAWRAHGHVYTLSEAYGPQVFLPFTYVRELDRKYRAEENVYEKEIPASQEVLAV